MGKSLSLFFIFVTMLGKVCAFPSDSVKQIHDLISSLYDNGEFNGSILVASRGKIVYSNGFGTANFLTGEKFTSPYCFLYCIGYEAIYSGGHHDVG